MSCGVPQHNVALRIKCAVDNGSVWKCLDNVVGQTSKLHDEKKVYSVQIEYEQNIRSCTKHEDIYDFLYDMMNFSLNHEGYFLILW